MPKVIFFHVSFNFLSFCLLNEQNLPRWNKPSLNERLAEFVQIQLHVAELYILRNTNN